MHMPFITFTINAQNTLVVFDQRKIECPGLLTAKHLHKQARTNQEPEGNRDVGPYGIFDLLNKPDGA